MAQTHQVSRPLTEREQAQFRKDFQDKEREIQKYITVYLSALVIVTGWIIGPESKGALQLVLGNNGYNICGWYVVLLVNIIFSCFLTYKSIIIHEIMQFVTYLSPQECGLQFWECWRRSPQSATRPVRAAYTGIIAAVPILVALIIMTLLALLMFSDPNTVMQWVNAEGGMHAAAVKPTDLVQLRRAFTLSRVLWVVVFFLHAVPIWFFRQNAGPTMKRWRVLQDLHPEAPRFDILVPHPFPSTVRRSYQEGDEGARHDPNRGQSKKLPDQ